MTSRQKALKLAEALGVTVTTERFPGGFEIVAEAPGNRVFAGVDTHGVVRCAEDGEPARVAWDGLLRDLEGGLGSCHQTDCDVCEEATR